MNPKFKLGDKVQSILDSKNYFIIERIEITKNGVQYWPQGSLYISWPETDLQLKKEKIKKYRYLFVSPTKQPWENFCVSPNYYASDIEFHNDYPMIKEYTKTEFQMIEVDQ